MKNNVKDGSTVFSVNVDCLSQDGPNRMTLVVKADLKSSIVAGLVSDKVAMNKVASIHIPTSDLGLVRLEDGELVHEANCRGQEVVRGQVRASAGLPHNMISKSIAPSKVSDRSARNKFESGERSRS